MDAIKPAIWYVGIISSMSIHGRLKIPVPISAYYQKLVTTLLETFTAMISQMKMQRRFVSFLMIVT